MFRPVVTDRFQLFVAITAIQFATIIGCGDPDTTDAEQVNVTIANLSDAALDPDSFQSFFVDGSAPGESQRHRYREYFYEMDPPDISGNSATRRVKKLGPTPNPVLPTTCGSRDSRISAA